jgi:DNA-binding GntR family transcriptional regulator
VVASSGCGYEVAAIDLEDVEDALDIRLLLESYAVRKAVTRMTPEQLQEQREICRREQECLKSDSSQVLGELLELNRRFHNQVVTCAGNRTLSSLVEYLQSHAAYRLFALGDPQNLRLFAESHCRLLRALEEQDGDAAEAEVAHHIQMAREILVRRQGSSS